MSATEKRSGLEMRRLPASAKKAAAEKAAERGASIARSQFSRTFADVLSGHLGGSWSVEWKRSDRPPRLSARGLPTKQNRRPSARGADDLRR